MHDERSYYHKQDKSVYLYWSKDYNEWHINDVLGDNMRYAYLDEDVLFPTLGIKNWIIWEGKEKGNNEDENIVVKKITEEVNNLYFFSSQKLKILYLRRKRKFICK